MPPSRNRPHACAAWAIAIAVLLAAVPARADEAGEVERLFRSGEAAAALQRAERGIAARPQDARLRFVLGVMLSELGRSEEAAATFRRLSEEFPELPEPYNNLAVIEASLGRLDSARALLETALRRDPGYRVAQRNLADLFLQLAARAYEELLRAGPADPTLERRLARLRELTVAP